jgi:hypothetical protein
MQLHAEFRRCYAEVLTWGHIMGKQPKATPLPAGSISLIDARLVLVERALAAITSPLILATITGGAMNDEPGVITKYTIKAEYKREGREVPCTVTVKVKVKRTVENLPESTPGSKCIRITYLIIVEISDECAEVKKKIRDVRTVMSVCGQELPQPPSDLPTEVDSPTDDGQLQTLTYPHGSIVSVTSKGTQSVKVELKAPNGGTQTVTIPAS